MTVDVRRVLAPNPGPMTLDGTNSWLIDTGAGRVVIDPGPDLAEHVAVLADHDPVLVLVTHRHDDHTGAIDALVARTRVPVRAIATEFCRDAEPLTDGERIAIGDADLTILHTPGHTADSLCVVIRDRDEDRVAGVATGDTILGRGSTVIAAPDGDLAQFLASLDRLAALGSVPMLPGHGDPSPDLQAAATALTAHRHERLDELRAAIAALQIVLDPGDEDQLRTLTDRVYGDVDPRIRFAAEASMRAQLDYLAAAS